MTQTTSQPTHQNTLNSPPSANQSLPKAKPRPAFFWQKLLQGWDNLDFQWKLSLLLLITAALPVMVVTQQLTSLSEKRLLSELQASVKEKGNIFTDEYVLWTTEEAKADADVMVRLVQSTGIDLSNPQAVAARAAILPTFLTLNNNVAPESIKSFKILTDAQGKTVAQNIQVLAEDFSRPQKMPANTESVTPQEYRSVSLPSGIVLDDLPIVKDALRTGRPLAGMELVNSDSLKQLGLEQQADVGLRPQVTKGLSAAKQPAPEGIYEIESGKIGLVSMAVYPIKINGRLVGTAIVGTLMNRNSGLPDQITHKYPDIGVATLFAQDLRVATNVPYVDPKTKAKDNTRAIGTRVSSEVAATTLEQKKPFYGKTNVAGLDYLTAYQPLYDHQKELDPQAKPVGTAFVAKPLTEVDQVIKQEQLLGYGIGGGILLLAALIIVPVAGSFSKPLRRLASFAQQVGAGERNLELEDIDRQDEIGILAQEMNQMVVSLEAKEERLRQDGNQVKLLADIIGSLALNEQDLDKIFNKGLAKARQTLKVDRLVIYLFNPDESGYISHESVAPEWSRALNARIKDPCIPQKLLEEYRQGRVVPTSNVFKAGFHPKHLQLMERLQIKANLVVPILEQGKLFGLLIAHHCATTHQWQETEINFMGQLAAQLGLNLERLRFLREREGEVQRSGQLKDITLQLAQTLDRQTVLEIAVRESRQTLCSERALVYCFDETWKGTVIAESVAEGWPKALGAEIADPCFAENYVEKYQQGRVQAIADIYQAGLTECHLKQLEPFAVKANLVAPILVEGKLLGLLIAHQCSAPRHWEQPEIDFFVQVAAQVGLAIERGNLLQQKIAEKEQLQRRALTLLMEVDPLNKGDLTIRATVTNDEIGTIADSYNATIENLRQIVTQVQSVTQQLLTTTNHNETEVQSLAGEALRQVSDLSLALERVDTMSVSIDAVATNAQQALLAVQRANETVEAGETAMNQTVDGMMAIRETVTETSKKIQHLGESSQKISKVVNLIGRFAAQTHLLALKASIEAARAGEEGRGFAVIADEVRTLAAQSAEATAEIETLVASIQSETKELAETMAMGTKQVVIGSQLVDETRKSLNQITNVSTQINSLVELIFKATLEQSQTGNSVTRVMTEVAAIAEHTSTSATQVSASFKELLSVAHQLQENVGKFKVQ